MDESAVLDTPHSPASAPTSVPLKRLVSAFPHSAAYIALLLALISGSGWLVGKEVLTSWIPGMPTMKVSTAAMIILQAVGLLAMSRAGRHNILLIITNLLTLAGASHFILNPLNTSETPLLLLAPSQATSLTLGLLALAQLLRLGSRNTWPAAAVLVAASLLPLHRLTTFLVGHGTLQTTGPFDSMSLPTSLSLYLLAGGIFLHRSLPYAAQFTAANLQGRILRLTLPWALLAPPLITVLFSLGIDTQLYNTAFVVVSVTATLSALMTVLLWLLTVKLQHLEDIRAAIHRELSISERYANQLIESSPDAMVVVNRNGAILRANTQSERLFGYPAAQLESMHIDALVPEPARAAHGNQILDYFSDPTPRYMGGGRNLTALHRQGREIPVEIALAPVESVHGPIVLANIVDITERLEKEAQLRASLEEKVLLLNEVHHRVKNNLQIVASLLSLQAGSIQDPEFTRLIAESEGRVRAMALVHQILYERKDFSHVELDLYLQRLAELQVQIHRSSSNRVSLHMDCDPLRMDLTQAIPLGQVVNELLSNAFKHAFSGLAEGELWITLKAEPEGKARLSVRDNGPGFPASRKQGEHSSLGMQLIELLCEQIGAELVIGNDSGGLVELYFQVLNGEPAGQDDVTEK